MANKPEQKETVPAFPFNAQFYPSWLLEHTDNLIDSPEPDVQDIGYELLDLYDEFGDEVKELVVVELPTPQIIVNPDQLILACFANR